MITIYDIKKSDHIKQNCFFTDLFLLFGKCILNFQGNIDYPVKSENENIEK